MKSKFDKESRKTLVKVLKYLKKYRFLMCLSVLFAFLTTITSLLVPVLIGDAIDVISGKTLNRFYIKTTQPGIDIDVIVRLLIYVAALMILSAVTNRAMNVINNRITFGTVADLRRDVISKLNRLPMNYFDNTKTGDIVNRVISDADTFADGLLMGFTQLFTGVITIFGTLVFMIKISPSIALIVVILTPISLFIAAFIAKNTHKLFVTQSRIRAEQTSYIDEIIGNEKLVKAYGYEENALEHFNEINDRLKESSLKALFFSSLVNPSTRFINAIIYAGVAFAGSFSVIGHRLTVGGLSICLSYSNQYAKPFNEISGVVTELTGALTCAGRIFEILESEEEIPDERGEELTAKADGNVIIDNVSFSYVPEKKLIENFNLNVKAGMQVAIVGPTGCGKTTLINLLMRFYDVDDGSIRMDGRDIRQIKRRSLRSNYGMVLQDTWLASGTIRENIAMGRPDADMEDVIRAAKSAHAHSFIMRLENGYDTFIEEGGGNLSQGQKQLLCIARIMLVLPPVLILDEATSSIDTRTELKISQAFSMMMRGRTSFVVAHRLSTIEKADIIIVMDKGHIMETGTHEELLLKGGFYHKLYYSQFAN
ncbi:MAG: ABC transporter ATP-binding protein [Clostridiales bacterium]|nr:ABC transporter ATP-binding protein [Clostridiales bacterium]